MRTWQVQQPRVVEGILVFFGYLIFEYSPASPKRNENDSLRSWGR